MALTPLAFTLATLACGASEHHPEEAAPPAEPREVAPVADSTPEPDARDAVVSSEPAGPPEVAAEPLEPAPASCVAGSYVHREPFFCILPPASYGVAGEGEGTTSFLVLASSNPSDPRIQIRWFPGDQRFYEQQRAATAQGAERDRNAVTRPTHDARGLYVRYDLDTRLAGAGGEGRMLVSHGMSVTRAGGNVFWCVASAPADAVPSPEFLSACETLTVTE
jgi:hypothetical protein